MCFIKGYFVETFDDDKDVVTCGQCSEGCDYCHDDTDCLQCA